MATTFHRWEKDPFFSAAEEVQESADRMESVYRRWVQERRGGDSEFSNREELAAGELRRELHTVLGTAKWQLEELERAVKSNDDAVSAGEDTRARHDEFVEAIGCRILEVENYLKESYLAEGRAPLSWVRLDECERDELALFLSAPLQQRDKVVSIPSVGDLEVGNNATKVKKGVSVDSSKNSSGSVDLSPLGTKEDTMPGHRRTASASADIGSWKILIPSEGEDTSGSSDDPHSAPLPKILSFSGLTGALRSKPRMKWYKNGVRKWTGVDQLHVEESALLKNSQLSQGFDGCYERSKSCLSTCDEGTYNKKLYGWLGAFHRQLQRSQYQVQYRRPIQLVSVAVLALLLIFIYAFRASW